MKKWFLSLMIVAVVSVTWAGCKGRAPVAERECEAVPEGECGPVPEGECEKDISEFTLGASAAKVTLCWVCCIDGNYEYELTIFDDGTGEWLFPGVGEAMGLPFTYEQTSCQPVELGFADGSSATLSNMSGSYESGLWCFHRSGDWGERDLTCALGQCSIP